MHLIVTTNWDEKFLDGLDPKVVSWVSGRLPRDPVGGSSILPSNMIKRINKKGVEKYIKKIHRHKMKFNYLLDGHCTGNKEYGWYGADSMLKMVKWISDSGADGVTVVLPHLVQLIKKDYPHLKLGFGSSRGLWEMTRLKYYDKEGVDWMVLHTPTTRYFKLLKVIRCAVKCDLWLVANTGCLLYCNLGHDHDNFVAHATNFTARFDFTDYFHFNCFKTILEKPDEFIKCPWIRPEDLTYYEKLGYDNFVISPNSSDTDTLLAVINAYKNRSYVGNLLDLLSAKGKKICQASGGSLAKGTPFIDNKKLDSFLEFFINKREDCGKSLCSECGYCHKIAQETVIFSNAKEKQKLLAGYQKTINRIEDGR
jgi:collagenase-like PrtC family protease